MRAKEIAEETKGNRAEGRNRDILASQNVRGIVVLSHTVFPKMKARQLVKDNMMPERNLRAENKTLMQKSRGNKL
jgi:hypothetical protein